VVTRYHLEDILGTHYLDPQSTGDTTLSDIVAGLDLSKALSRFGPNAFGPITAVSSAAFTAAPQHYLQELAQGTTLQVTELGLVIVPFALPEDEELEEMVSYGKNITGIDNTIFISPKGNARHGPRLKVAIDPPDSISPHGKNASVSFDGSSVGEPIPRKLFEQVMKFIELNRDTLNDYWEYRILTDELQNRLQPING
jgi:hypothetical protein